MALSTERLAETAQALEYGRELYATGRYFDAHVAWEAAWHREAGPVRRLLQGLIQSAAAYHKLTEHHGPGMAKLLERAIESLRGLPDGFAGLQLDRLRAGLMASRHEAVDWCLGGPCPSGPAPLGTYLTADGRPGRPGPSGRPGPG